MYRHCDNTESIQCKLDYKNYTTRVEFDSEDKVFFGRIAGIQDIITFHGESVDELVTAFELAVDDYLQTCEKIGQKPNLPYSGELTLNVPSDIHAAVAIAAELSGKTINQWATETLARAVL
jgi:predicted HicB family RNase H-like nuclease